VPRPRLAGSFACIVTLRRSLLVTEIIVVVAQQRRVLTVAEVLFEAAFALRVNIASASEEGEENGEKDESVGRSPEDEGNPDAEVVYIEDLRCVSNAYRRWSGNLP
jgi:hypothetical protein